MNLLELPDNVLEQIFQYLPYDDIATNRLISTRTNIICQSLLNRGVVKLKTYLSRKITELKPFLPRRESERWDHPADKKIRYLELIKREVRMVYYVYEVYIKIGMCCFIPGRFIDLAFTILRSGIYPESTWLYSDSLNEMTDAGCMAKEHFMEKIEPILKKRKVPTVEAPMKKDAIGPPRQAVSNACQFQDGGNCSEAYTRINKNYRALRKKCNLSNKNYNTLLKKFTCNKKVVMKKLTNYQNEIADLQRRLEKLESNDKSETQERNKQEYIGETSDLKQSLRSSKRLRKQ